MIAASYADFGDEGDVCPPKLKLAFPAVIKITHRQLFSPFKTSSIVTLMILFFIQIVRP